MMEKSKDNILNFLIDLKNNHCVSSIKTEFETEGASFDEAMNLKKIVEKAGLQYTLKIGGCEAIKDLQEAKKIGVDIIVAPMIESSYAMQKFAKATSLVFSPEQRQNMKFYINIESIMGFNNFDEIISSEYFSNIDGIVLGRGDLVASMGLSKDSVDSSQIFVMTKFIAQKMQYMNKEFIIGGNVSDKSIPFFKKMESKSFVSFETRKVIFDTQSILNKDCIEESILKALEFELLWIKSKNELSQMDASRLQLLERRCSEIKKSIVF